MGRVRLQENLLIETRFRRVIETIKRFIADSSKQLLANKRYIATRVYVVFIRPFIQMSDNYASQSIVFHDPTDY